MSAYEKVGGAEGAGADTTTISGGDEDLLNKIGLATLPDWTAPTWDAAIGDYLMLLYEGGARRSVATRLMAALIWMEPALRPPVIQALPMAYATALGWGKL